jgi:transposase-like protein
MRNVLSRTTRATGAMVAAVIRTIFAQPDAAAVKAQHDEVATTLARSHPKVADMLLDAKDDLLAFTEFPVAHWRQIWSTNPIERLNKQIKRRTAVVGTFPNPQALARLAGHVLIEQHDEWDGSDRRYFSDQSMALLRHETKEVAIPEITAA